MNGGVGVYERQVLTLQCRELHQQSKIAQRLARWFDDRGLTVFFEILAESLIDDGGVQQHHVRSSFVFLVEPSPFSSAKIVLFPHLVRPGLFSRLLHTLVVLVWLLVVH